MSPSIRGGDRGFALAEVCGAASSSPPNVPRSKPSSLRGPGATSLGIGQEGGTAQALDKITEVLIEKETISGKEFRELLSQYTTIPQENLEAAQAAAAVI